MKEQAVSILSRIPVAFIHKQHMKILFERVLINNLAQSSIVINDENYLEIMETIYDFPNEFEGKEIELLVLSTTIQIIPIVNLSFALVLCTVSLIQEFLAS